MARKNMNVKTGDTTVTLTTETHIQSIWGGEVQLGDQVIGSFECEALSLDRPLTRKERGQYIGRGWTPPATVNYRKDVYHGVAANGATIRDQSTRVAVLRFLLENMETPAAEPQEEGYTVIAEDAPLGVCLVRVNTPEAASSFTLDRVSTHRTVNGTRVEWTYQDGSHRYFDLGEEVYCTR